MFDDGQSTTTVHPFSSMQIISNRVFEFPFGRAESNGKVRSFLAAFVMYIELFLGKE